MALTIGTQLGSLEISALLGKGGMGEVYRARDLKLKREVAIKILPEEFSRDADRVSRFQREAEVLASLNHPNIATIHDLEEANGSRFLVLELVEGETLEEQLRRGPIPIEDALKIAKDISEALEAAHEKGIIHRDLKPANVKVTAEGRVKVLDFGLAKALQPQQQMTGLSNSPTVISGSIPGVILGTAAYMSPEQVRGKETDARSDIWAFGCVLYEMLTGRPPFQGETIGEIFAGILKAEPEWAALPNELPGPIRGLLRRCLMKDRRDRLQAIGEARIVIDTPSEEATVSTKPSSGYLPALWIWAALVTAALLAVSFLHFREKPFAERTLRYTITAPENSSVNSFAVSPDGQYLVIAATVSGRRQLWLRRLDQLQLQSMEGTEDGAFPFWSPSGDYIGFFSQGRLKKIAVAGGPPQSLCSAPDGRGGSWSRDGIIVFSPVFGTGLRRVSAAGGVPAELSMPVGDYRYPSFLPDDRHFLYTARGTVADKTGIFIGTLDGTDNRRILPDLANVILAPPGAGSHVGYLLFIRENTLMAQPFDTYKMELAGDVFPIAAVSFSNNVFFAPITVSGNGVLVYGGSQTSQIVWLDRSGKPGRPADPPGADWEPAISPDQKAIAFRRQNSSGSDIWIKDLIRGTDTRLTSGAANLDPSWSPDGNSIVFNSNQAGPFNLYQKAVSGSGQAELLVSTGNTKVPDQWSRDGKFIVYSEVDSKTAHDLWVLPIGEADPDRRKPIAFLHTEFNELKGQLSPDSHWMAYTSDESGRREIYIRSFPISDRKWRISTAGGDQARWRGDGKELFFVAADGNMTAVTIKSGLSIEAGPPLTLFQTRIGEGSGNVAFQYDVTSDGGQFVLATNYSAGSAPTLTVVVNWKDRPK